MPKESRSRMQKWPSSTLCPPNSTVTGTTHFYPVAIRSAHVICAQALSYATNSELLLWPQFVGFVVCIALRGVHSATKTDFAEIAIPINAAIYTGFVLVLLQVFRRADSK